MNRKSRRQAFTLRELAVGIGAIAVLIYVLLPLPHHGGRENARRGSCQNNLKQMALAVKQYMNDYDEY